MPETPPAKSFFKRISLKAFILGNLAYAAGLALSIFILISTGVLLLALADPHGIFTKQALFAVLNSSAIVAAVSVTVPLVLQAYWPGYVAARIARHDEILNALLTQIVPLALVIHFYGSPPGDLHPAVPSIIDDNVDFLGPFAALLGGYMGRRATQKETARIEEREASLARIRSAAPEQWMPPRELNQPVPRRVRMHNGIRFVLIAATILFLGTPVFLMWTPYKDAHMSNLLKTRGVAIEAQIVTIRSEILGASHPQKTYFADYRFELPGASGSASSVFQGTGPIKDEDAQNLKTGQNILVLYDPDDPSHSALNIGDRIHTQDPYVLLRMISFMIFPLFGGFYALIAGMLLFSYYRDRRLVVWGRVARATIINEKEVAAGGTYTTTAIYEFKDESGKTISSSQKRLPNKNALKYSLYSKFLDAILANPTVLYDPKNSSRNRLYLSGIAVCLPPKQN